MNSGSTSEESSTVTTFGIRGFPVKCVSGTKTTIYTSETDKNPGRPFFRCLTRGKQHLFKWVEEAVYEEVQDALPKIERLEDEITKVKAEVEDLKGVITELMEEFVRTKREVKRGKVMMKICFGIICLTSILVVVKMM